MATFTYKLRGKSNPSSIHCRFIDSNKTEIRMSIGLLVDPNHWDQKKQQVKNIIAAKNRDAINRKLSLLKMHVIDQFNLDYMNGEIIDKTWLKNCINDFFKRPKDEGKKIDNSHLIYYTDFIDWWIKEKSPFWEVGPNKFMTDRESSSYKKFGEIVKDFQKSNKITFKTLSNKTVAGVVSFLHKENYSPATIKRHVGRFKFFCLRAEENGVILSKSYKQRVYIPHAEEIKEPYLNEQEIEKIYNYDFSKSDRLDNVRDNLIIAVWTGLRISDFGRLDISNFIDDTIQITTQKTGTSVIIPVHPMVKKILIKRNGKLPNLISDQRFNRYVKEVCEAVGLNQVMKGRLYDKEKKRKVTDMYAKHLLISSHIGRRSFATNHYGKLENQVIMDTCGWSSEAMMRNYIKKTKMESAVKLQQYWEENYN